ncbi:MAG TPA: type I phosphomannose isomerase catalytic subunit [Patescibacteria group bacterium]|nr:type I phosphomannose isomerase catalytic subunit [Patescibacteria group bacterium]
MLNPFRAVPLARERVWGGTRLGPPGTLPIGELWLAGPSLVVADGPYAGQTLDALASELGPALVGSAAPLGPGPRFPLLLKLLDPAEWLSVQVHPNDAAARRLAGPDAVGKAEAWYVLEAEPGAELLAGTRPGVREVDLRAAMRGGASTTRFLARHAVTAGDVLLVTAGTLHAVGPGLLLYELQQPSDLTYRVDDWARPASRTRPLHTKQALACVIPRSRPTLRTTAGGGRIVTCRHFTLDVFDASTFLGPAGRTVQLVTAVGAPAEMAGTGWSERLEPLETIVVPADAGAWELRPGPGGRALVAGLP